MVSNWETNIIIGGYENDIFRWSWRPSFQNILYREQTHYSSLKTAPHAAVNKNPIMSRKYQIICHKNG